MEKEKKNHKYFEKEKKTINILIVFTIFYKSTIKTLLN